MELNFSYMPADEAPAAIAALFAAVGSVVTVGTIRGTLRNVYFTGGQLAVSVVGDGPCPDFHMGAVMEDTIRI
jgi:hypothetical protein